MPWSPASFRGNVRLPMARVLVLFAHPALEKSRVNRRLLAEVSGLPCVDIHDLYEQYPEFDVDVEREQNHLVKSEVIVLMYPLYWYNMPALLKQWLDLVLSHGFAYGSGGTALCGKKLLLAITAGGSAEAYQPNGFHGIRMTELLAPLRQTARLCGLELLEPFVVYGALTLSAQGLEEAARAYHSRLLALGAEPVAAPASEASNARTDRDQQGNHLEEGA